MPQNIQTKHCSKCKKIKAMSEFGKMSASSDGLHTWCKQCFRSYAKSDRGRQSQSKYLNTNKCRNARQRYRATPHSVEYHRKWSAAHKLSNPEQYLAGYTVNNAVQRGEIPPAKTMKCNQCSSPAEHYHHEDYSKPLDLVPLCRHCHYEIHQSVTVTVISPKL